MAAEARPRRPHELLSTQLAEARVRSAELFRVVRPSAIYQRPIPERHRIVFYLGHLETFDWNLICAGLFEMKSMHQTFDRLFAFGIDPTQGNLPSDNAEDWPKESEIQEYNRRVRQAIDSSLSRSADEQRFWVAIEHQLMHAETLTY